MVRSLGVMTGTSVDAIDVALCAISNLEQNPTIELERFVSVDYSEQTLYLIHRAISNQALVSELSDLQFELSNDYYRAIIETINGIDHKSILCIGAHGQTIWHNPPHSTFQILNGSALAQQTNIPVVHDFRSADIALGGQGAPLVPLFDFTFFAHPTINRAVLNIGGMSNLTILPANSTEDQILAFDCGPGNVLIDIASKATFGKKFDDEGKIARAGQSIQPLLERLQSLEYFSKPPPKSTGRELFNEEFAKKCIDKFAHPSAPSEDVVATFTELTAWCIADHVTRFGSMCTELICSGGGTKNTYLMERIAHYLPEIKVLHSDSIGFPSQAKEAMCFAFLAARTMFKLHGNMPSVTGASRKAVLGTVSTP
ncbi:MAG: anhydro-N-acetylmuramic acid kinase [Ignavibacteria bacterium]|nr:anhydro-N-acetylmuramic acid kinase [Ignavibacteria bacterium]